MNTLNVNVLTGRMRRTHEAILTESIKEILDQVDENVNARASSGRS